MGGPRRPPTRWLARLLAPARPGRPSLARSHRRQSLSVALSWRPSIWAHRSSPFRFGFSSFPLFPLPPSFMMPSAPVRRPSASANHSSSTPSSSVRQHRSAESHHAFTGQPPSLYSSNTSSAAAHQQKIIHILVNRLRNKVLFPVQSPPCLAHLL